MSSFGAKSSDVPSFPRSHRLTRPGEFTRVYRQGRRCHAGQVQIVSTPATGDRARLGLAIARRVLPRAVDRNRVKRLIRESFRQQAAVLPALDIVVSLRRGGCGIPADMRQCLETLWLRLARD